MAHSYVETYQRLFPWNIPRPPDIPQLCRCRFQRFSSDSRLDIRRRHWGPWFIASKAHKNVVPGPEYIHIYLSKFQVIKWNGWQGGMNQIKKWGDWPAIEASGSAYAAGWSNHRQKGWKIEHPLKQQPETLQHTTKNGFSKTRHTGCDTIYLTKLLNWRQQNTGLWAEELSEMSEWVLA